MTNHCSDGLIQLKITTSSSPEVVISNIPEWHSRHTIFITLDFLILKTLFYWKTQAQKYISKVHVCKEFINMQSLHLNFLSTPKCLQIYQYDSTFKYPRKSHFYSSVF